jgi:Icc-related predicted phosphoesterase
LKIIATSDIHGHLIDLPAADVLCIAGDITFCGKHDFVRQADFINGRFIPWIRRALRRGVYRQVIWIAGNHDVVLERFPEMTSLTSGAYLRDEVYEFGGVRFYGTPWSSPFFNWGFNASDERREKYFGQIPEGIDVLLSHAPPRINGLGKTYGGEDAGDSVLLRHILRARPKYVFCGHIHEGHGLSADTGDTKIYNVSMVDLGYNVVEKPYVEIEI